MVSWSSVLFTGFLCAIRPNVCQQFSVGFRSGLFPGHVSVFTCCPQEILHLTCIAHTNMLYCTQWHFLTNGSTSTMKFAVDVNLLTACMTTRRYFQAQQQYDPAHGSFMQGAVYRVGHSAADLIVVYAVVSRWRNAPVARAMKHWWRNPYMCSLMHYSRLQSEGSGTRLLGVWPRRPAGWLGGSRHSFQLMTVTVVATHRCLDIRTSASRYSATHLGD